MSFVDSGYLPPVVIDIMGRDSDFFATVAQVKAALADLSKQMSDPTVGMDKGPFDSGAGEVTAEMRALDGMVARPTISPQVDMGALGLLAGARTRIGASAIATALGLAASGGGDGGDSGKLLWGGLGGGMAGLAGLGSLGSFLGFGGEHLITTGLGVGGSAIGGLAGGGLLGLGALGVGAVGIGTDMAGIGQAAGDINSYTKAYDNLQKAVFLYGANSTQAKNAQAALNYTLAGFPAVAQQAIVAASQTAQQFHQMFNQVTGEAEKIGAQILTQLMQVGEQFLPVIGQFAEQNMAIIQQTMQPLMQWLTDSSRWGGLGIFKDLEQIFQKDLPTGMHALTQGIELFAKTVDVAAQYVGPFLHALDDFLTKTNTTGFAKWATEIGNLIGLFRTWLDLFLAVGKTIWDVFQPALGAGQAIVQLVTNVLDQIDKWISSTSMQDVLSNLFSVHLAQLIQGIGGVLQAVLPLIEPVVQGLLQFLAAGAQVGTALLQALIPAIRALQPIFTALQPIIAQVGQILATLLTGAVRALAPIVLVLAQTLSSMLVPVLNLVGTLLTALSPIIAQVAKALGPVLAPLVTALTQAFQVLLPPLTNVINQLGPILTPVITKLGTQLVTAMSQGLGPFLQALVPLIPAVMRLVVALLPLIPPLVQLATIVIQQLVPFLPQLIPPFLALTKTLVSVVLPVLQVITNVVSFLVKIIGDAISGISKLAQDAKSVGGGLIGAGISAIGSVGNAVGGVIGDIPGLASGGLVTSAGLAVIHAGERVVPAAQVASGRSGALAGRSADTRNAGNSQTIHVTVNGDVKDPYQFSNELGWRIRTLAPAGY